MKLYHALILLFACCSLGSVQGAGLGIDQNQNSLSDVYELLYPSATTPGADTDGDGQTNLAESISGTDPTNSRSTLDLATPAPAQVSFASVVGKQYQLQSTSTLAAWADTGASLAGTGGVLASAFATTSERTFLRVSVQDKDSDADGVSDWEESLLGLNPQLSDTAGNGSGDYAMAIELLTTPSTVLIVATDALASETGPDPGTFTVIRRGGFAALTVNLTRTGTATSGTDYTALPATVSLAAGATSATLTVTPLADAQAEAAETVTLSLAAGTGYTVGTPSSATVSIGTATGTVPEFTSANHAGGLIDGPFQFDLTTKVAPTSYFASGLPAGLTINTSTGRISGTPQAAAVGLNLVTVGAQNSAGATTMLLAITIINTGHTITRDAWTGLATTGGVSGVPVYSTPTSTSSLTLLQGPANVAEGFGSRIRGYVYAPMSGNYTFWISGDESAELWISSSTEPADKLLRAFLTAPSAVNQWTLATTQKSLPITLTGGQGYYIEVVQKENTGSDHVEVGWAKPTDAATTPSEIVPAYALHPYTAPAVSAGTSTLYLATLTPQSGAASLGSGSAVLQVNEAQTTATLSFSSSNLSSAVNGMHIHSGAHAGAIIYDIDDATPDADGTYHWTFTTTGNITASDIANIISTGQAYLNIHTVNYPSGEIKGYFQLGVGSQFFTPPAAVAAWSGAAPDDAEAVRFLQQASFGADAASITSVKNLGYSAWIDDQFTKPATSHLATTVATIAAIPPIQPNLTPSPYFLRSWYKSAATGQDQLRQRVAFALSQITVISFDSVLQQRAKACAYYYDLLGSGGLGNFRTLLKDVTLAPAMGLYLDMLGNKKADASIGRTANENYAREVLQLFSIGLNRLHPDGTLVLSSHGTPVPTYDQNVVVGFANTFTGWTYAGGSPAQDSVPMTNTAANHDVTAKTILNGAVIPAGQTGAADLDNAIDTMFYHPNIGPFICRQLIQRLVTSNPSPAYVYRVASVFNDNGSGVRGDMKPVIKAILMDPEARDPSYRSQQGYSHLREPVLRITALLRALHGSSTSGYWNMGGTSSGSNYQLSQTPLAAASVFNFYEPNYIQPGETGDNNLFAPEFQITSEASVILNANFVQQLIYVGVGNAREGQGQDIKVTLTTEMPLADTPSTLVDTLNTKLMAGQMSQAMKDIIVAHLNTITTGSTSARQLERVRAAIFLITISPEFCVMK
jgi:uncharacterized protein (DUF1800 family)